MTNPRIAYRIYTRFPGGRHRGEGWSGMCELYYEVAPPRRLALTVHWDADVGYNQGGSLAPDELMSLDLEPVGDGTRLTLRHRGIPDDGQSIKAHEAGMREALDILSDVVGR